MEKAKRRFSLLVNPAAGGGRAGRLFSRIARRLEKSRLEFSSHFSEAPGHLTDLARGLAGDGDAGAIPVVCGGDGSVNEVFNGLPAAAPPLGIIPCGTGDDLARNLGIPLKIEEACDALLSPRVLTVDLARTNHRCYAGIGGAGIDSEVTRRANESRLPLRGHFVYTWAVLATLFSFRPREFCITADGWRYEGKVMFAAVANAPSYGGGMRLSPDSLMDDGQLEVCIVEEMGVLRLLGNFPGLFRGTHVSHPKVRLLPAKRVRIEAAEDADFYADGEYHQPLPVDIEVSPASLRLLAADGAGRQGHA